jgi:REP element-mobilizing transposase RayT
MVALVWRPWPCLFAPLQQNSASGTLTLRLLTSSRGQNKVSPQMGVGRLDIRGKRGQLWSRIMARKLRVEYSGAVYHVMNRGDRREPIHADDQDRLLLLETLAEACEKTDWQVHAWCLLSNHFHLVSETPRGNLVRGMQWLLGVYTNRFNHRHKEFGHLFSGRYKALAVDGNGNGYGGEEVRQSALAKAQRIAQEELDTLGWAASDLQGRRKSDPQKVRIAARLRRETTMTLKWIADRLWMGAATHVASLLQRQSQKGSTCEETLF